MIPRSSSPWHSVLILRLSRSETLYGYCTRILMSPEYLMKAMIFTATTLFPSLQDFFFGPSCLFNYIA